MTNKRYFHFIIAFAMLILFLAQLFDNGTTMSKVIHIIVTIVLLLLAITHLILGLRKV